MRVAELIAPAGAVAGFGLLATWDGVGALSQLPLDRVPFLGVRWAVVPWLPLVGGVTLLVAGVIGFAGSQTRSAMLRSPWLAILALGGSAVARTPNEHVSSVMVAVCCDFVAVAALVGTIARGTAPPLRIVALAAAVCCMGKRVLLLLLPLVDPGGEEAILRGEEAIAIAGDLAGIVLAVVLVPAALSGRLRRAVGRAWKSYVDSTP